MQKDDLVKIDEIDEDEADSTAIDAIDVSNDLSSELTDSAVKIDPDMSPAAGGLSAIEALRSSTPPVNLMTQEILRYADKKISTIGKKLRNLEYDVISNLPEYVETMADLRDMNKVKYRMEILSYDEIKVIWLRFIHGIL